ncbi:uncharacterized protein LOC6494387 isoform X2 [Drosophila ananassae]|uniref:uncharacterized protein LOC6494387 isoform X2 n=1 Tax=Drosophila ananassae TaxID=7217 RepID=UPI001CFFC872|nr:uncharacterized protein LOC6494387 isoform X2 [Drosophila ananassae]
MRSAHQLRRPEVTFTLTFRHGDHLQKSTMPNWMLLLLLLPALGQGHYYYDYGYWEINEPPPLCSDYEMLVVNTRQCVRRCNIVCREGVCFEDGPCPCADQYQGADPDGVVCAAECLPGCQKAGGYCAAPDLCVCSKGSHYYFDALARKCRHRVARLLDPCLGHCSQQQRSSSNSDGGSTRVPIVLHRVLVGVLLFIGAVLYTWSSSIHQDTLRLQLFLFC